MKASPVSGLCTGQATSLTQQPYLYTVDSSDLYSVVGVKQGGDSSSTYPGPCVWPEVVSHRRVQGLGFKLQHVLSLV